MVKKISFVFLLIFIVSGMVFAQEPTRMYNRDLLFSYLHFETYEDVMNFEIPDGCRDLFTEFLRENFNTKYTNYKFDDVTFHSFFVTFDERRKVDEVTLLATNNANPKQFIFFPKYRLSDFEREFLNTYLYFMDLTILYQKDHYAFDAENRFMHYDAWVPEM